MSIVESAPAHESAQAPLPADIALKTTRTLVALTTEFELWISEEIESLARAQARFAATRSGANALGAFRQAVRRTVREARTLGYPLVAEIAGSLETILEASRSDDLPGDIVDAHLQTMAIVASDRSLSPERAKKVVTSLSAAATDYISGSRPA